MNENLTKARDIWVRKLKAYLLYILMYCYCSGKAFFSYRLSVYFLSCVYEAIDAWTFVWFLYLFSLYNSYLYIYAESITFKLSFLSVSRSKSKFCAMINMDKIRFIHLFI